MKATPVSRRAQSPAPAVAGVERRTTHRRGDRHQAPPPARTAAGSRAAAVMLEPRQAMLDRRRRGTQVAVDLVQLVVKGRDGEIGLDHAPDPRPRPIRSHEPGTLRRQQRVAVARADRDVRKVLRDARDVAHDLRPEVSRGAATDGDDAPPSTDGIVEGLESVPERIGACLEECSIEVISAMPQGKPRYHTARRGIVDRRPLAREVRQCHERIAPGGDAGGAQEQLVVGHASRDLAQPAGERAAGRKAAGVGDRPGHDAGGRPQAGIGERLAADLDHEHRRAVHEHEVAFVAHAGASAPLPMRRSCRRTRACPRAGPSLRRRRCVTLPTISLGHTRAGSSRPGATSSTQSRAQPPRARS